MKAFEYFFSPEYANAMWLYTIVFLLVTTMAFLSQKKTVAYGQSKVIFRKGYFIVSFIIACLFYVLSGSGTDLVQYASIYKNSSLSLSWIMNSQQELLYAFLNALLHSFIKSAAVGIGVIKALQIAGVYFVCYKLKDKISVGYFILAYMSLFYFQSFNLIRIALAGSIGLIFILNLLTGNEKKAIFCIVIASLIHRTAIILVLVYCLYKLYELLKPLNAIVRIAYYIAIPIVVSLGGMLINELLKTGLFFDRFNAYVTVESTSGIAQVIFYIPVFLILLIIIKNKANCDSNMVSVGFVTTVSAFIVAMLGYQMGMLTRMAVLLQMPFTIMLPYYVCNRECLGKVRLTRRSFNMVMFSYWVLSFVLTLSSLMGASGLGKILFVWEVLS